MRDVKVSVIIPFFGVEEFIEECLSSVVNQTFRDLEVICVDDGSLDDSKKIVLDYMENDSRVRLLCNESNQGVSASRNRGIEIANGEYVYIMDSDDVLMSHAIEKLYQEAKRIDADLVWCDVYRYYPETQRKEYFSAPYHRGRLKDWTGDAAWWFLFRKELVSKNLDVRFPVGAHPGEDTTFSFMLLSFVSRVGNVKEPLLYYRQHPSMCMKQIDGDQKDQCFRSLVICIDVVIRFYEQNQSSLAGRKRAYINFVFSLYKRTKKVTGRALSDFPLHHQRLIRMCIFRRFFYEHKITRSGSVIIRICKLPVFFRKVV